LLDSRTLREALDGAESVQKESDMHEEIAEEEEELGIKMEEDVNCKMAERDYFRICLFS